MKVAVLISGGVDSSVALHLARQAGHDVTAFYLKVWLEDEMEYLGQCPWEEDLEYIHAVCDSIDVPVQVVPIQQDYWQRVIEHSLAEIKAGRTPNPDMLCNSRVKFGAFLDQIDSDYERVITGHYAHSVRDDRPGNPAGPITRLMRAPDPIKDQTYFLAQMSQQQIARAMFPLGQFEKSQVRELAHELQLPNMDRPDSQGLCFLGKISFRDFVKHHLGEMPGDYINLDTGERVGEHKGYWFYTIGQRHGLGLSHGPWFVAARDIKNNIVYISNQYYNDDKARDELEVGLLNWVADYVPEAERLQVKLRHGPRIHDCKIEPLQNAAGQVDRIHIKLDQNDQGIAAGQYAVFYKNNECLGSGMILEDQVQLELHSLINQKA